MAQPTLAFVGLHAPDPRVLFKRLKKYPTLGLRAAATRRLTSYTLKGTGAPACGRVKIAKTNGFGILCLIGLGGTLFASSH